MANPNLIVDDDYCNAMANFFKDKGAKMDEVLTNYLSTLKAIKSQAITTGATADAIEQYTQCCQKLSGEVNRISLLADQAIRSFIKEVDEADEYLF